jgi:hypothetical protein
VTGKEKVRFGFDARRRGFFWGEDRQNRRDRRGPGPCFSTPRVCAPVDRGPGRDDARVLSPPRTTRACARRAVSGATASRRAFVASRDARREVRRITRLPIGRTVASRSGGDRGASAAGNEEEDAVRTWTWKTAPCGRTCGCWRNGGDDARSAPGRVRRATRRRATDAGMSASSDEALHRWRCKTRSHPGAGSTPARAFATRHVSRTHLEGTDTLPATRAADMVMADMFVEGLRR